MGGQVKFARTQGGLAQTYGEWVSTTWWSLGWLLSRCPTVLGVLTTDYVHFPAWDGQKGPAQTAARSPQHTGWRGPGRPTVPLCQCAAVLHVLSVDYVHLRERGGQQEHGRTPFAARVMEVQSVASDLSNQPWFFRHPVENRQRTGQSYEKMVQWRHLRGGEYSHAAQATFARRDLRTRAGQGAA